MKKPIVIVVAVLVVGVIALIIANIVSPASSNVAAQSYILKTAISKDLGEYLVASNGMTLYTFGNDVAGMSTCVGQCATNWPPYTISTTGSLAVDPAITGGISILTRKDGTTQATYRSLPLYYFKNDKNPGDTTGQGVGGLWVVARP